MASNLDFSSFLDGEHLDEGTKRDLISLFEYAQYLFDEDVNLTKTMNLTKKARDMLLDRIKETLETTVTIEGEKGVNNDSAAEKREEQP